MKKSLLTINLLILFIATAFSQNVHQEWVNSGGPDGASAIFIVTDAAGNVYVAGPVRPHDAPDNTFLFKYSPSGATLFAASIDTPCYMVSAFKDVSDNIYIDGNNSLWAPPKSTLIKFNSSGVKQWRITESITANDGLGLMAGDNNGNPCLLRRLNGIQQMVKYNSLGVQQLVFNIPDSEGVGQFIVDAQNNFITIGIGHLTGNVPYMYAIKYSSAGVKLWKSTYIPAGGSMSEAKIAVAASGNIYITASVAQQVNTSDYFVIKYNPNGQQQWTSFYNRNQNDGISDMALDNLENTYIAGSAGTVKFSSSGAVLWSDTTAGGTAIAIDRNYNVYETGANGYPSMMKTFKVSSMGNFVWSITYSNMPPFSAWADAIALDTPGNIFITGLSGYTPLPGYSGSATTIKYSQVNGIVNLSNSIPSAFKLNQNYPNPFNPTTKIKFSVPLTKGGDRGLSVILKIFDVLGKEVAILVNQQLQPGTYEVEWNASDYSSGVYYYRITAGDFSEVKKMIILK
jgi:hypothetical protein